MSSQGKSNNVSSSFDGPCDSKSFEDTTSLYMINCEYNQLLRSKDGSLGVKHRYRGVCIATMYRSKDHCNSLI